MAITIHQQPAAHSAIGSKTIIVASSSSSGNDGFQYVIAYTWVGGVFDFIIPPNAAGRMVFDPTAPIKSFARNSANSDFYDLSVSIHCNVPNDIGTMSEISTTGGAAGFIPTSIIIQEGWIIDGVFTPTSVGEVQLDINFYNAQLSLQQGLNYDYLQMVGFQDGDQSRIMSDRDTDTHQWLMAESYGLNSDCIFVPTYESDWGVWSIRQELTGLVDAPQLRLAILPDVGAPVQQIHALGDNSPYINCPIYPANLNASPIVDILKPSDYPNWKAVYFQILNAADEVVSKTYVMYNAERDGGCERFDKIRLAWVGRRGGWEYHNFTMKSEESFVTEKVVTERVVGNPGQVSTIVPYAFNTFDESEVITDMKIQRFITAKSDWLTEGEFAFLKGLFLSKQVHWVQDDGSHIPVILEANGYNVKRQFNGGKLYDQEVKFKIAQEQFN